MRYIYLHSDDELHGLTNAYTTMKYNTKSTTKTHKEFMSDAINHNSNLHGTCAMFLKKTLPDQPKTAVFHGITKIHRLPYVIKTITEC